MTDQVLTGVRDEDLLASIQPFLDGGFNLVHLERSLTVRRWTAFLSTDPIDQVPVPVTGSFEVTLAIGAEVEVSNFPATQPVSIAAPVPVTDNGGSITVDGSVSVSNFPGTQPVSGTVSVNALPAGTANIGDVDVLTMPVVQVGDNGGSLTVDGAFFQATQPVSLAAVVPVSDNAGSLTVDGSVSVSNFPATQPVSLAALPALVASTANIGDVDVLTLPASITDGTQKAVARGGAKGATAAADITSTASGADHQPLDVVLYDSSANRFGTLTAPVRVDPTGTTTQPVSLAALPALVAGSANIGDVDVLTLPALVAGTARIGSVRPVDSADADLTVAKDAQSTRMLAIQNNREANRSQIHAGWLALALVNAGTSALANFTTGTRAAAAITAANNVQVTAGKIMVVTQVSATLRLTAGTTTPTGARIQIRQAASVANTSPIIWEAPIQFEDHVAAVAGRGPNLVWPIPEGLHIPAGQQWTVTVACTTMTTTSADVDVHGFEY